MLWFRAPRRDGHSSAGVALLTAMSLAAGPINDEDCLVTTAGSTEGHSSTLGATRGATLLTMAVLTLHCPLSTIMTSTQYPTRTHGRRLIRQAPRSSTIDPLDPHASARRLSRP